MTETTPSVLFENQAGEVFSTSIRFERVTQSETALHWLCTIFIEDSEGRTLVANQVNLPLGDQGYTSYISLRQAFWAAFHQAIERFVEWHLPEGKVEEAERPEPRADAVQTPWILEVENGLRGSLTEELKKILAEQGFGVLEPEPGE